MSDADLGQGGQTRDPFLHLAPVDVWTRQRDHGTYVPEAFSEEGFIHCTIGEGNVIDVGNRYYKSDDRAFVALAIDPERLTSPVRIEDAAGHYPHIYGPLNVEAVVGVLSVRRAPDGVFLAIERTENQPISADNPGN